MRFDFVTAGRIIFGPGAIQELAPSARALGSRVLFVRGGTEERVHGWIRQLQTEDLVVCEFPVTSEPTVELVISGVEQAKAAKCDAVVAMGGGSVLDCGKAIATMLANPGSVYDYLEVVGKGKALVNAAMPCIAVPTTAGTGTEVTRNAVLGVTEKSVKVSLRGPQMLPRVAIVDPQLTYTLPPAFTASSGMDALTQLVEPFLSIGANAITDPLCRDGMARVRRSLVAAYQEADAAQAREDMSIAALFGGMALANAKLGAAHGFAGPIGGKYSAGHGAICGRLLPVVVETNLRALREREPQNPVLGRFDELARILSGRAEATAEDGIEWLYSLREILRIPPLSDYGVRAEDFADLVSMAIQSNSLKGNPIKLTEMELRKILEAAA